MLSKEMKPKCALPERIAYDVCSSPSDQTRYVSESSGGSSRSQQCTTPLSQLDQLSARHWVGSSYVTSAGGLVLLELTRLISSLHVLPPPGPHGVSESSSTSAPSTLAWQRPRSSPLKSCTPTIPKTKKAKPHSIATCSSRGIADTSACTVTRMPSMRLTVRSGRSSRIVRSAPTPLTSSAVAGMTPRTEKMTTTPSSQFHIERR